MSILGTDSNSAGDINTFSPVYLTGWEVVRATSWTDTSTHFVHIYQNSFAPWSSYIRDSPTAGGIENPGPRPVDAVDGSDYLSIYHDFAPPGLTTETRLNTEISGLVPGQAYRLSYWYAGVGETNNGAYDLNFDVLLDGSTSASHNIMNFTDTPPANGPGTGYWATDTGAFNAALYTNWTEGTVDFTATTATTALSFIGLLQGGPAQLSFDNISVASIPEPTVPLFCFGGMLLTIIRRRR